MEFFKIAAVNIGATILSIITAIMLALKGYGYWALVWREIIRSVCFAAGTWLVCPWIPGLIVRKANIGAMIRFGKDVTGFNLVVFFAQSLDQILIGKFYGANLLGIYRQACQLIIVPIRQLTYPVSYVAESALSLLQNDPIRYRQYYKKILTLLSATTMPLVVFLFLHSRQIILLLLGEKWIEAAPIFKILAISAFISPLAATTGFVMVTCGNTRRYFLLGLVGAIIGIVALSIGIKWGAVGIAIGYVLAVYIYFLPTVFIGLRETPVNVGLFFRSILPSAICSLLMGVGVFLFSCIIHIQNSFSTIIVSLPIAVVVYFISWMLIPGGRLRLKEVSSDFLFLFKKW